MSNAYQNPYVVAADSSIAERSQFLRRTYLHLAGALLLLVALDAAFLTSPIAAVMTNLMIGTKYSWLIVLGLFMGASWLAQKWALSGTSMAMQYAGLGLYVLAESIILIPLLFIAASVLHEPNLIAMAGMITMGLFLGLTAIVVTTRKDFSFLGGILNIAGFVALGFIIASAIFGFSLGNLFIAAMALFAGGAILYHTSLAFHQYSTNQYVAAALGLFASVVLLFFYVLQFLIGRRN